MDRKLGKVRAKRIRASGTIVPMACPITGVPIWCVPIAMIRDTSNDETGLQLEGCREGTEDDQQAFYDQIN